MMVTWDRQAEAFRPIVMCSAGDTSAGNGGRKHLDGVAAPFLVLALTQQAVRFDVVARHWHGLNYMEAVAGEKKHVCWCMFVFVREQECVKTGFFLMAGSTVFCQIQETCWLSFLLTLYTGACTPFVQVGSGSPCQDPTG